MKYKIIFWNHFRKQEGWHKFLWLLVFEFFAFVKTGETFAGLIEKKIEEVESR